MLVIDNEENKREVVQGKYFKGNFLGELKEKMPKKKKSNQELLSVMMSGLWVTVKCIYSSDEDRAWNSTHLLHKYGLTT